MTLVKENYEQRNAREQASRDAFNKALPAIATKLGDALGSTWLVFIKKTEYHYETDSIEVKSTSGERRFEITTTRDKQDRFYVSGRYPRDARGNFTFPYQAVVPSITVAVARGGAALGREIVKRFLPEYDALFIQVKNTNADRDAHYAKRLTLAKEVAALVGKDANKVSDGERGISFYDFGPHKASGEVTAYEDSMKLDLSLSPELGKQVLALIAGK